MDAISVSHVGRHFRDGGIHDVSLTIAGGERFAVFGDAGAGKTVLLQLLAGRLDADAGDIRVLGELPSDISARIGFAVQSAPEKAASTPRRLISAALSGAQVPSSQRPARLAEALHAAGLYDRADRPLREMNYSAMISVRIAASTAHRPDIILIDDLLRLLPLAVSRKWWRYLDARRTEGATVVHATMDSAEAEAADRVLILDRGIAVGCAAPRALLAECRGEEIAVEAEDIDSVERTLRGIPSVEAVSSPDGIRFYAADGSAVAAHLFRHPIRGMRSVFVRRPSLWDCLDRPRLASAY